jgi:hypothetical protein
MTDRSKYPRKPDRDRTLPRTHWVGHRVAAPKSKLGKLLGARLRRMREAFEAREAAKEEARVRALVQGVTRDEAVRPSDAIVR